MILPDECRDRTLIELSACLRSARSLAFSSVSLLRIQVHCYLHLARFTIDRVRFGRCPPHVPRPSLRNSSMQSFD